MYLLVSVLELSLPGFEVLDALGNKLIEGEFVIILFEGIFEEAKDVLIDVDGEVGG